MPDELVYGFGGIVVDALADRAWTVFAPRMRLLSPFAVQASEWTRELIEPYRAWLIQAGELVGEENLKRALELSTVSPIIIAR